MFTLSRDEIMRRSQIVTAYEIKYSKRVSSFTEQDARCYFLKSQRAIEVNIAIMRAFVHLRKMIASHKKLAKKLFDYYKFIYVQQRPFDIEKLII
jgi:hypothetical protein